MVKNHFKLKNSSSESNINKTFKPVFINWKILVERFTKEFSEGRKMEFVQHYDEKPLHGLFSSAINMSGGIAMDEASWTGNKRPDVWLKLAGEKFIIEFKHLGSGDIRDCVEKERFIEICKSELNCAGRQVRQYQFDDGHYLVGLFLTPCFSDANNIADLIDKYENWINKDLSADSYNVLSSVNYTHTKDNDLYYPCLFTVLFSVK